MAVLSGQLNRFRLFSTDLHTQRATGRADRKVTVSEPPHQVKGLSRWLRERKPLRILRDGSLDGAPHMRSRSEEAVSGHEPFERLMRPLEVVAVDEKREPLLAVSKIRENRLRQKLFPQRLPKPLRLAHRLRMLRPALDVPNPLPP